MVVPNKSLRKGGLLTGVRPLLILVLLIITIPLTMTVIDRLRTDVQLDNEGGASAAPLCESQPTQELCASVKVGDIEQRYALYMAATPTADTVIYDPGGPGVSALSGTLTLQSVQERLPSEYNLLVLEEPWVTKEISENCSNSMSGYYSALREAEGIEAAALSIQVECALGQGMYGFTPERYREAVSMISESRNLQIKGFLGHSFGSVRLSYLDSTVPNIQPAWAIVTRPFPVGVEADELMQSRADVLRGVLPGEIASHEFAVEISSRSIPVTRFDQFSAFVGTGYVADAELDEVLSSISSVADPQLIGTLSDQLWMRYGVDALSPGVLAFWEETCDTMGQVTNPPEGISSVEDILFATASVCDSFDVASTVESGGTDVCVTSSVGDSVAPASLIGEVFDEAIVLSVDSRAHGDVIGWEDCWDEVVSDD